MVRMNLHLLNANVCANEVEYKENAIISIPSSRMKSLDTVVVQSILTVVDQMKNICLGESLPVDASFSADKSWMNKTSTYIFWEKVLLIGSYPF
jgi:hypothetical protein